MSGHADTSPIILLGAHRSGTTWLGKVLSAHPALAYHEEPRHVWTWGNARTPDDRLTAEHARPEVVEHIRASFEESTRRRGRERMCEKTPSNCLRVPFIRAVYPDAKLLFVVRDGRSVIRSTGAIMDQGVPTRRVVARALRTPVREWPAYAGRVATILRQKLGGAPLDLWGPHPPGWRAWVRQDPRDVVLARQWAATVGTAADDLDEPGAGSHLRFRYEDMARAPAETMGRIVGFLEISEGDTLIEAAVRSASPASIDRWRGELSAETLAQIRPHMEPTLNRLGYTW